MNAFTEMIPHDCFPLFVLFIDLDTTQVDINVHPTKQEIKFEDEKIVYAFVQAAVKHALAQFSITPTLDFDLDPAIQKLDAVSKPVSEEKKAAAASSSLYKTFSQKNQAHLIEPTNKSELPHWKDSFGAPAASGEAPTASGDPVTSVPVKIMPIENAPLQQLLNTYIVTPTNRSFILVHQQAAHERILYERYKTAAAGERIPSQKSLFPVTLTLSAPDAILLTELLPDLLVLGYDIGPFGKDSFIIQGTPADMPQTNEKGVIESLLEQYKHFTSEIRFSQREKLIRTIARQQAVKPGTALAEKEMRALVDDLFACAQHNITPGGDPTYIEFKKDYVERLFGRQ
jgi:DNA mismatch repair protein MutL